MPREWLYAESRKRGTPCFAALRTIDPSLCLTRPDSSARSSLPNSYMNSAVERGLSPTRSATFLAKYLLNMSCAHRVSLLRTQTR